MSKDGEELSFEVYGDAPGFEFDPEEWTECSSPEELMRKLVESAEDQSSWGISLRDPIGPLWEQVQAAQKNEAKEGD